MVKVLNLCTIRSYSVALNLEPLNFEQPSGDLLHEIGEPFADHD